MLDLRYYAIGHSYLLHGPFDGWQTEGFWGMAATEPSQDYYHKFINHINKGFECKIRSIAENHAMYERICVSGATEEDYTSSEYYAHMKDVLRRFKPNLISVFIGGGNTIAQDDVSLTLFYKVLYDMIAKNKPENAVVVCIAINSNNYRLCKPVADEYNFVTADVSFLHEKQGYDNPYYAFSQYPDYDSVAATGAVEFRTHPGNEGHSAIADLMYESVKDAIAANIPHDKYDETIVYEEFLADMLPEKFDVLTSPEMTLNFSGFNISAIKNGVSFSSAPGTGASFASDVSNVKSSSKFCAEMSVQCPGNRCTLNLTLTTSADTYNLTAEVTDSQMHVYDFDLTGISGDVTAFRLSPDADECLISLKSVSFCD